MTHQIEKVIFSWSGGKDSALALDELRNDPRFEIVTLMTTLSEQDKTIPMHAVHETLLEQQAASLELPLVPVYIPAGSSNEQYERRMYRLLERFQTQGISKVVHADLFLEDVRRYREKSLNKIGFNGVYPLWGRDTKKVSKSFINAGFKAIITCVDTLRLDHEFIGEIYDQPFLDKLPDHVDPCGENGEFHTFVFDGPGFRNRVSFVKGNTFTTFDGRFIHQDMKP